MKPATNSIAVELVSAFTGRQVVAVFSGFRRRSTNRKTGPMLQVHLLDLAADLRRGPSATMCGGCWRRPSAPTAVQLRRELARVRKCYVGWARAPLSLQLAVIEGRVPTVGWVDALRAVRELGDPCRLGASGDPAHLGVGRVGQLAATVPLTGYTRAWHMPAYEGLQRFLMASADVETDAREAWARGWRTFRARRAGEPLLPGESQCQAAREAGARVQCIGCLECGPDGTSNQTIVDH